LILDGAFHPRNSLKEILFVVEKLRRFKKAILENGMVGPARIVYEDGGVLKSHLKDELKFQVQYIK
jgi:hypothetical protein